MRGGLLAYPTEAVWGLGCDPFNEQAVFKLLRLKRRPAHKGLILVAASVRQLGPLYNNLNASQKKLLDDSWPGPNTWLIPDPDNLIPAFIKGDHSSVAIRVSAHRGVNALCSAFGSMIVSTSANQANQPEIRSRLKIQNTFGDRLDYVLPGQLGGNAAPSTIRDLSTGQMLR